VFILKAAHLKKTYSGRTVVDDVSFDVGQGEIVGLLGPNGAGKTTSFRMTMGMIGADQGAVWFNGEDVSRLPMYQRAKRGMGYLAQEPSIFQKLTVEENLMAILETKPHLTRMQMRQHARELMERFDLIKVRGQHARLCSGGEKRKLEIARALVGEPSMMLLDEPFSNIDPITVEGLQEEVRRLRNQHHIAMLITDHNVAQTMKICDRVYMIFEGKVFREGTPRELVNDEQVRRLYLGHTTFRGDEFDAK